MAIVLINPNSTVVMTEAMVQVAQKVVPELKFEGWTSHDGPPSIQGAEDGALAEAPLLELVRKADAEGADGIIIGCFDDTALDQAARLASCPVVGIGHASYHYAALRQWKFSVVTTLAVSVPVLEQNISKLGLDQYLARVRASNVPVLSIHEQPEVTEAKIVDEAKLAEQEDGIDAVILGCGGMVEVTDVVRKSTGIHVIDPAATAAKSMKWLAT